MTRGGGQTPKDPKLNIRTQFLNINKANQNSREWDYSYFRYLVNVELVECSFKWANIVDYEDLQTILRFPNRLRSFERHQPYNKNEILVYTKSEQLAVDNVTRKTFKNIEDRPQLEIKDPEDRVPIKDIVIEVFPVESSTNVIEDWTIQLKVTYIDEPY